MQIPFQYSLHYIENENEELKHKEFLAEVGIDPRRKLAEKLVNDIPENACVLAYNMQFEKMVIKNLAELYEDLREDLLIIHNNIKDLMIPFVDRMYYCKEMQGSYSIKYVLPALFPDDPELDYHNLPLVHNGGEAMSVFATLDQKTKEEQEEITHMFYQVFEGFLNDIKSENKNSLIYTKFLNHKKEKYLESTTPARRVLDFIAGMTDEYFIRCASMFKMSEFSV